MAIRPAVADRGQHSFHCYARGLPWMAQHDTGNAAHGKESPRQRANMR
jgi:hypothetical protein